MSDSLNDVTKMEAWVPELARSIFNAETIRNGAMLTGGWGFLSPKSKEPYYEKARQVFSSPARESVAVKCEACNGHGLVGNILNTETCPFCLGSGEESSVSSEAIEATKYLLGQLKNVTGPNAFRMWEAPDNKGGQFADKRVALLCWLNRISNSIEGQKP